MGERQIGKYLLWDVLVNTYLLDQWQLSVRSVSREHVFPYLRAYTATIYI